MKRNRNTHTSRFLGAMALSVVLSAGCADTSMTRTLALGEVAGAEQGECTTPLNEQELTARVVELVNEERAKIGVPAVTFDAVLSRVADNYACRMIREGFFSHRDPEGEGPGERAVHGGYVFLRLGENLAAGQTTAEQAVAEWMASTQGHRENILSPEWTEIGVAVRLGGEHGIYWVQEFGLPPGELNPFDFVVQNESSLGR